MGIVVVSGTGTEIGKTVVTAAVAAVATAAGRSVAVLKPAQTGIGPDERGDADEVVRLSGAVASTELGRFPEPLAWDGRPAGRARPGRGPGGRRGRAQAGRLARPGPRGGRGRAARPLRRGGRHARGRGRAARRTGPGGGPRRARDAQRDGPDGRGAAGARYRAAGCRGRQLADGAGPGGALQSGRSAGGGGRAASRRRTGGVGGARPGGVPGGGGRLAGSRARRYLGRGGVRGRFAPGPVAP